MKIDKLGEGHYMTAVNHYPVRIYAINEGTEEDRHHGAYKHTDGKWYIAYFANEYLIPAQQPQPKLPEKLKVIHNIDSEHINAIIEYLAAKPWENK